MDVRPFRAKNFHRLPSFPRNDCFSLALMTKTQRIIVITTLQAGIFLTLMKAVPILCLTLLSVNSLQTIGMPFHQPLFNGSETMQTCLAVVLA